MEKDYKIVENQSIYDIANSVLGGFDNIYAGIIELNPTLGNINFNLNTIATQNIIYDDIYFVSPTIQIQLNISKKSNEKIVTGLENQSIYDVVLMNYGSLDSIYEFIQMNDIVSINDTSVAFKKVIFDNTKLINETLTKSIQKKGYQFGTVLTGTFFRILENGDIRITEDGNFRILE